MIESAFAGGACGSFAFWLLVIAALFTSFYSWRLMFLTFFGEPRGDKHTHEHAHESPNDDAGPAWAFWPWARCSAGMIWYEPFFGDHRRGRSFFGIRYAEAGEQARSPAGLMMRTAHAAGDDRRSRQTRSTTTARPLPAAGRRCAFTWPRTTTCWTMRIMRRTGSSCRRSSRC